MKTNISIFLSGFTQVFLVSANIYFISRLNWPGIAFCGFGISLLWAINVRKVSTSNKLMPVIYAGGAMFGGLSGVFMAQLLKGF